MPNSITRAYLRTRYWTATIAITVVLLLCIGVGWSLVRSLQSDAHFARAFSQLIEATHHLRAEIEREISESRNASASSNSLESAGSARLGSALTASGHSSGHGSGHASDHVGVEEAFKELTIVFTAIRDADPDGLVSETDDDAADESEAHWDRVAQSLIANLDKEILHFRLAGHEMPESLVTIWESESSGETPELEELIGEVLEIASVIVESEDMNAVGVQDAAWALQQLISIQISPVFHSIAPVINDELTSGASYIFYVLLATAVAVLCALIFNTLIIFAPLEQRVVTSQRTITQERDRAVAAEKAKQSFLAVMSHELRTPMNGIIGFANLLLKSDLNEKQRDYAQTICSSGDALLGLLNDVLDISKIEADSLELENSDFDLKEVVKGVVNLLGPRAYTNRLELSTFIDPGLPQTVNGDAGRVRQILLNLVGNAIKFTPSGAIAIEVTEEDTIEANAREVRIAVTDTGVGIPQDKVDAIFDRFVQVDDGSERKYEGTGLGLAICKKLAALMGGRIGVESTPDQGSTFWVTILLRDAAPAADRIADATPKELRGRRVLVVDDNALNRRIFKLQLQSHDVAVELTPDARSAMRLLTEARKSGRAFELAIIDHMMPETDGVALASMIRAEPELSETKLILSSSSGLSSDHQAGVLGFDAACPKPVHQDKVLEIMLRLLSNSADGLQESGKNGALAPADPPRALEESTDPAKRILIVEDNPINLRLAVTVLEASGYSVDTAGDGNEALRAVQATTYDLILMDIRMPGMGGIEATKLIRALDLPVADCPIVAMTANAIRGDRERYLEAGMTDYISKPIDIHNLVDKVKEVIGSAEVPQSAGATPPNAPAAKSRV